MAKTQAGVPATAARVAQAVNPTANFHTCEVRKEGVLQQLQCSGALPWIVCNADGDELPQALRLHLGKGSRGDALHGRTSTAA